MNVSAIGFGAWAIGGSWGPVDDDESMRALHASVDAGVNFIDTADVYGDGHSERLVARLKRERPGEQIWVATKAGRRLAAQTLEGYSRANLESWIDRSLANLETEALDLLQLHCPHSDVYDSADVFGYLDGFMQSGKIRYYGVSVETVDEAMRALKHPNVQSVQIIFNMFRQKPQDAFFAAARDRNVGILARVPLASGLLTGKLKLTSRFDADDHRNFNRQGEHFDKGETFSGVPVRRRAPGGRGAPPAGARGRDDGAVGAALGADGEGGDERDSGSANGRAGGGQCGCRRIAAAVGRSDGRRARRVRRAHPAARPRSVVTGSIPRP